MLDRNNRGITLIALVITIIVLLILAGITISLALGENGIFKRALQAKQATRINEVKEEVQKWLLNNEINEKLGYKESIVSTEDFLKELKDKGKITEDEYNKAMQSAKSDNPKIAINNGKEDVEIPLKRQDGTGSSEQGTPSNPKTPESGIVDNKTIKRGDIIKYDPTRDVTDKSLLSYTSPEGDTSKTTPEYGGNGEEDQTITVEPTMNEWKVLKNDAGKITLISKEPTSQKMNPRGGQGWLYAEREIHKACSIYGYGKGADKSQVTKYIIGNPFIKGEAKEEKITGSGARSITLEDLEELGNINEETKKRLSYANCEYGKKGSEILKGQVGLPTINSTGRAKGSEQLYKDELITTFYRIPNPRYHKNKPDIFGEFNDLVFLDGAAYYTASRRVEIYPEYAIFDIVAVDLGTTCGINTVSCFIWEAHSSPDMTKRIIPLRPVVTLSRDVELIPDGKVDGKTAYRIK